MERNKSLSSNRAITLVALIITIIVMLILVAVTVRVVVNSDIIGQAEEAGAAYRTAYEEESIGKITIGNKVYNSIAEYFAGRGNGGSNGGSNGGANGGSNSNVKHEWTRSGDILTCICETCTEDGTAGRTLTIGDTINYTKTGSKTSTIPAAIGGTDSDQTISITNETIEWKVLGAEDKNSDGKDETLLLTTATPTNAKITLQGAAVYNNIEYLHTVCEELYGEDARAMTVEDVVNCLDITLTMDKNFGKKINQLTGWDTLSDSRPNLPTAEAPNGAEGSTSKLGEYKINAMSNSKNVFRPNTKPGQLIDVPSGCDGYILASQTVYADFSHIYGDEYDYVWFFSVAYVEDHDQGQGEFIITYYFPGVIYPMSPFCNVKQAFRAVVELTGEIPEVVI